MYSFATICCACLFQSFIELWVGYDLLLEIPVLIVILINFYLNGMRKTVLTFREALGLYWYDRYKPIFESVINLIVSIFLVQIFGLVGVFIGTTISCLTTSFWVEPYVLCKYGFENEYLSINKYFSKVIFYSILMFIDLLVCLLISSNIVAAGVLGFVIKSLAVIIASNLVLIACLRKTWQFKWYAELLIQFCAKALRRNL